MKAKITNEKIELLRNKLENLITEKERIDSEVVSLSQKLDKLIYQYYLN